MQRDPVAACTLRALGRRGMTVTRLAEITGLDRSTLTKWLSGQRAISTHKASRVMTALGLVITEGPRDAATNLDGRRGAAVPPAPPG